MWYPCLLVLLCASSLAAPAQEGVATTARPPPRTLDRQAAELAWRTWLQSPESGNQNAPPRRITTKSLFITPLVCPKGQRLDRDGCVEVVTVEKDEHERILLEQLNALFTSAPADVQYDYGDDEPGPLQLSIPIGLEPQAAPLQAHDQPLGNKEKKDKPTAAASIEAELELLKLEQQAELRQNHTRIPDNAILSTSFIHNNNYMPFPDKPKRNSPETNKTQTSEAQNITEEGQKEVVFGHVKIDPYLNLNQPNISDIQAEIIRLTEPTTPAEDEETTTSSIETEIEQETTTTEKTNATDTETTELPVEHDLKSNADKTKLNPEIDYSDIGEAIKLISRYAEVTTDDNFSKDQNKLASSEESVLGTRTRQQHRRNKPKPEQYISHPIQFPISENSGEKLPFRGFYPKREYYRYPWLGQHSPTPPPDYPYRHLQDYWPGRSQVGGVYNTHENPRRHHHSYPHNYFRPHNGNFLGYPPYPGPQEAYGPHPGLHRLAHHPEALRTSHNQDLYSLLGLRHWFSSESTKR